jgi:hypothetical protein
MSEKITKKKVRAFGLPMVAAVAVLGASLLVLSACGKATGGTDDVTGSATNYGTPGLYGEVTDVSGNQITLKLIKIAAMPTGGANRPSGDVRPSGGVRPTGGMTRPSDGAFPSGGAMPSGGVRPTGGAWGGNTVTYTGETKVVTIPAALRIITNTTATDGTVTSTVVDITEVKAGNFLAIYYGANGTSITKVVLSTTATTGGGRGGRGFPSGGAMPTGGFPNDNGGQPPDAQSSATSSSESSGL